MHCYIYEPQKHPSGEFLAREIEKVFLLAYLHIDTDISGFINELLHSCEHLKVAIIHVCDSEDIDHLIPYDQLLSGVLLFVYVSSPDPSLLSKCYQLRPRMICRSEEDIHDLLVVLKNLVVRDIIYHN
ncbi:MAG: hypothetical protein C4527_05500 [Candidatus Omnitrophota bacterium]|nr:MAG: hypothetical protein C4527_05500 [Candidatus Omnitrophota bacterium]